MRILVTGGSGFLGGHVAGHLAAAGHEVLVFDLNPHPVLPCVVGDLTVFEDVLAAVTRVGAVCHLGAVGDVYLALQDPPHAAAVNVVGTAHVLEAARRTDTRKVVYASTWEVYGRPEYQPMDERHPTRPDHPYGITKLAGEHLALSYDLLKDVPTVSLRIGTAYGTGMRANSVFSSFVERALREEPIVLQGGGGQSRQFTHATDIAAAFRLALESELRGECLNIVADESHTIRELAELVVRRLPTEIVCGEPRIGDVPAARVSTDRARVVLNWNPLRTFEQGLDEILRWQLRGDSGQIGP